MPGSETLSTKKTYRKGIPNSWRTNNHKTKTVTYYKIDNTVCIRSQIRAQYRDSWTADGLMLLKSTEFCRWIGDVLTKNFFKFKISSLTTAA